VGAENCVTAPRSPPLPRSCPAGLRFVFTPAGAPYPTAPYPTPPASRTPRAFDPNDPAAFATDLALQIDAAEQALVDLIKVLARLADGPQPGDVLPVVQNDDVGAIRHDDETRTSRAVLISRLAAWSSR